MIIKRPFFSGSFEIFKLKKIRAKEIATRAGLTEVQWSRIMHGKAEPSLSAAYRFVAPLSVRLDDILNLHNNSKELLLSSPRQFLRLPYYFIDKPRLVSWVENENSPRQVEWLYQSVNEKNRYQLFANFWYDVAKDEEKLAESGATGPFEYYLPPNVSLLEGFPETLLVGEVVNELRKRFDLSTQKLAELVDVSSSFINKLENNLADVGVSSFDAVAQAFGLSSDELIYLAYPPHLKTPLFIPAGKYQSQEMFDNVNEANGRFKDLNLLARIELMLGYKDWLKQEHLARLTPQQQLETSAIISKFRLKLA